MKQEYDDRLAGVTVTKTHVLVTKRKLASVFIGLLITLGGGLTWAATAIWADRNQTREKLDSVAASTQQMHALRDLQITHIDDNLALVSSEQSAIRKAQEENSARLARMEGTLDLISRSVTVRGISAKAAFDPDVFGPVR